MRVLFSSLLACLCACSSAVTAIGKPEIHDSPARHRHPSQRILVVVSTHAALGASGEKTGYWLSEVTHFVHVVARHGFAVEFTSPKGAAAALDPGSFDLDDDVNAAFHGDATLRARLEAPRDPTTLDPRDYAAIYYAGGHGTMWDFPAAQDVAQLARAIYEAGGVVAAVCHGPSGLLGITLTDHRLLIADKRVTGFSNTEEALAGKDDLVPFALEDALVQAGGKYTSAFLPFSSHVVVDGRLITGQNPASAAAVGEALMAALGQ